MVGLSRNMSWMLLSSLLICILPSPSVSMSVVFHNTDEHYTEEGSALDDIEECLNTFVGYENTFLRGVGEDYFITYNKTSYEECLRYCCSETHFVCNSFSYFEAIEVCYVMNMTMHEDHVQLATVPGWKHYHKEYPTDETTFIPESEVTTMDPSKVGISEETNFSSSGGNPDILSIDETTSSGGLTSMSPTSSKAVSDSEAMNVNHETTSFSIDIDVIADGTTTAVANEKSSTENIQPLSDAPTKDGMTYPSQGLAERLHNGDFMSKDNCAEKCQNGGTCEFVATAGDVVSISSNAAAMCKCQSGFKGKYCETVETEAKKAGPPVYVIAGAVIGIFVFLLFATVVIVFVIYQHKRGKYQVKNRRLQWRKRAKKTQTRRSHSFIADEKKSPLSSNDHGSDDSIDDPSSTTSV